MSNFNEEVSHFKLEWWQLLYPSDDMNDEDLNDILMQIDMPEPHENLVLGSNSFGGINRKFVQPSPHHAVSFSLCSCFLAIYELLDIMFWHVYQTFIKFLGNFFSSDGGQGISSWKLLINGNIVVSVCVWNNVPCAQSLVVLTGSSNEQNMGTQSLLNLAQEWKMYHSTWHGKLWRQNKSSLNNRTKAINQGGQERV
jgi:hypothetical protein